MGNDMEMYLEKVLKKTNPEKYIEILEQDREDFAKKIVELNQIIDKAIEFIKNTKVVSYEQDEVYLFKDIPEGYDLLSILQGSDKE